MKKILIISSLFPSAQNSNSGTFVYEYLNKISSENISIDIIVPVGYLPLERRHSNNEHKEFRRNLNFEQKNIKVFYVNHLLLPRLLLPFTYYIAYSKIQKMYKKKLPFVSLIHAHYLFPNGYIAHKLARNFNTPYFITCHGSDVNIHRKKWYFKQMYKNIINNASVISVVSNKLKEQILLDLDMIKDIKILRNGFNFQVVSNVNKEMNKHRYLFVGNLIEIKGIINLVHSFINIIENRKVKDIELIIIGEGSLKQKLQSIIKPKYSESIKILGRKKNEEVYNWMKSAKYLILPSYNEGFPTVLIESLSVGTPIIANNVGGISEVINTDNGFLMENNSVEEIESIIIKSLGKSFNKDKVKESVQNYSWKKIAEGYTSIYEKEKY